MDYIIIALCAASCLISLISLFKVLSLQRSNKADENFNKISSFMLQQNSILKQELQNNIQAQNETLRKSVSDLTMMQQTQLAQFSSQLQAISENNEKRIENMRLTVERELKALQNDNNKQLENMRLTVDEKLSQTLEKRFNESFALISKQLQEVYTGLGEMKTLASGVGDLKKVLTNIKTRGTWGEISLGNLLEQLLAPQQYKSNVKVKPRSNDIVEFAICLPGKEDGEEIYLPIDSKFPIESYIRLVDASNAGDAVALENAQKQLAANVKMCAKTIRDKYIYTPKTTDFAIMYLPIEGLYAEVTKNTELCEQIQRDRITIMGPTTLGAFLNSLQMGFKTLAIEKRSSEVWKLLGAIKLEFSRFGIVLEKTQKKLSEASKSIEDAAKRTKIINNKLNKVETAQQLEDGTVLEQSNTQLFLDDDSYTTM